MKVAEQVKIARSTDGLKIVLTKDSKFTKGMHGIYFINVFNLERAEDFSGYTSADSISPNLISELINYFEEHHAEVELDEFINSIIQKIEQNSSLLETSRIKGANLKAHPVKSLNLPKQFKRALKPYQIPCVAHILETVNAANFSVPGSGKTTITLAAYSALKKKKEIEKLVVIGPRACFMPWEEEFYGCFQRKPNTVRISGSKISRKALYKNLDEAELILLTYQMANKDESNILSILKKYKTLLVLDESHNIKKLSGGQWSSTILSLAPFAKRRIILTGTPVPNSLEDLWTQMTFLWPEPPLLGTPDQYKDQIKQDEHTSIQQVTDQLNPFYWRIRKSDLKLKEPKFHRIDIKMLPYQQAIYDALASKVLSELIKAPEERLKLRAWRKAKMIRLLQTASNPSLLTKKSIEFDIPPIDAVGLSVSQLIEGYSKFETPAKISALVDLTTKLIQKGEKVLIWTSFIQNIKTLQHLFDEFYPRVIYGEIPKDTSENDEFNREKMIHEFKNSNKYNLLIANPSACAESISLHKICHHAIYIDRTFNGAQYMQSLDRIHRIGLGPNEQVHYYILRSKNTVDEVIDSRLEEKQRKMLRLLNDDFAILDLDSTASDFTEESEEEVDFNAIIRHLKNFYS